VTRTRHFWTRLQAACRRAGVAVADCDLLLSDQDPTIPLRALAEYHKYLAICDEIQQPEKTYANDNDNGMDCLYF